MPDAYAGFPVRLIWQGRPVAGLHQVGGLRLEATAGGSRGRVLTLGPGLTRDRDFLTWAHACVADPGRPGELRRDLLVELHDEHDRSVLVVGVLGAWVSALQAEPGDEHGAVLLTSLVVQHDGWERMTQTGPSTG